MSNDSLERKLGRITMLREAEKAPREIQIWSMRVNLSKASSPLASLLVVKTKEI